MSDYGDFCRDMRDYRRQQKDKFRYEGGMDQQIKIATEKSRNVEIKNDGEHYILDFMTQFGLKTVDFWPSTGKWKIRNSKKEGVSARGMIAYLKPQ